MELLHYLRKTHLYCIYCVARFSSDEEMDLACPGITEEEHE
jgi:hypothetical protein